MKTKTWLLGFVLVVVSLLVAGCSNCPMHRALFGDSDDTPEVEAPAEPAETT